MLLFADTDFILKLCAFDLLQMAIDMLGIQHVNVRVLPTAKYKIGSKGGSGRRLLETFGEDGVRRALAFVNSVPVVDDYEQDEADRLAQIPAVDSGEAILIAAAAKAESFVLATGDKACIRALGGAHGIESICSRLFGNVLCVEEALLRLIKNNGFVQCKERIAPVITRVPVDRYVGMLFKGDEVNVMEGLQAELKYLHKHAPTIIPG